MYIAIATISAQMASPLRPRNSVFVHAVISAPLKVSSMVPSNVSMDTQADASEMAREAENAGLPSRLYLIRLIMAMVSEVKV